VNTLLWYLADAAMHEGYFDHRGNHYGHGYGYGSCKGDGAAYRYGNGDGYGYGACFGDGVGYDEDLVRPKLF
jgi:hypothetical protein